METGHPDAPSVAEVPLVFAAGGIVGRDLAAVDWAATPLGPPERWQRPRPRRAPLAPHCAR